MHANALDAEKLALAAEVDTLKEKLRNPETTEPNVLHVPKKLPDESDSSASQLLDKNAGEVE